MSNKEKIIVTCNDKFKLELGREYTIYSEISSPHDIGGDTYILSDIIVSLDNIKIVMTNIGHPFLIFTLFNPSFDKDIIRTDSYIFVLKEEE